MKIFILVLDIIGTASFALSGAVTGLKKRMDVFGVCMMGLTTATAGGIIRDVMLGLSPPSVFKSPSYIIAALAVSLIAFLPFIQRKLSRDNRVFDIVMLITDSAGLGIFTVLGVKTAMDSGFGENGLIVIFVAVMTGVGGGILRDIFAGDRPYVFVKHIYALASLAGALVCYFMFFLLPEKICLISGFAVIVAIRLIAAKYRLNLPHPIDFERDEKK